MEKIKLIKLRYIIVCAFFIIICTIAYITWNSNNTDNTEIISTNYNLLTSQTEETKDKTETTICVHIAGEVINPGVFEIEQGSRIKDVILLAGGTTEMADLEKVNLAYQLNDGQKVRIPNKNDKNEEDNENQIITEINSQQQKININTAKEQDLETITGIGPSTAQKIIQYRNKNGRFKKIEDIKNVPGIGDIKFNNIKEKITV